MSLATFVVGAATVFLASHFLPPGTEQTALAAAGGTLVGLVLRGPGLVTRARAERMASEPPPPQRDTARESVRARRER